MAVSEKTFTFTGYAGNLLDSRYLTGQTVGEIIVVPSGPTWSDPSETVDYYVSNSGSDSNAGTTPTTAFRTIKKAMQTLVGKTGKTVQVQDGTYQGSDNLLNDYIHSLDISGASGARNRIQAQTTGGAIITDQGISSVTYPMGAIRLTTSTYVDITGFRVEFGRDSGNSNPATIVSIYGNPGYNRLARCIVRRTGNTDTYGSWIACGGSYNLIEDCSAVGATRYGFACGGCPTGDRYIVWRRCLARYDYSQTNQPRGPFNHYGCQRGFGQDGTNSVAYLNCMAIDGYATRWLGDGFSSASSGFTYGMSLIKTVYNDQVIGCIMLNNEFEYGAYWIDGYANTFRDNIAYGTNDNPFSTCDSPICAANGLFIRSSNINVQEATRFTLGDNEGDNIYNAAGNNFVSSNNRENPTSGYLLYPPNGPYSQIGATILNRTGESGTFWGETGWNSRTDESLWPWRDEALIKTVFSQTISEPSGGFDGRTTIDTKRGFCSTGTQLNGVHQVTLTSYIWEALGTQMPTSIYGT